MHYAKTQDNEDEVIGVLITRALNLKQQLARASEFVDGHEYDESPRRVTLELYWHEGEFYVTAEAPISRAFGETEMWGEGSASGDSLTPSLLAEALTSALDGAFGLLDMYPKAKEN